MTEPRFGDVSFYQALADALNDDRHWLDMATDITYSMTHVYSDPIDRTFFLQFDGGKLTEVAELGSAADRPADFVIAGHPDTWQAVITKATSPLAALTTGKLKVDGKLTTLIRQMAKFTYMIDKMTTLEPSFPS